MKGKVSGEAKCSRKVWTFCRSECEEVKLGRFTGLQECYARTVKAIRKHDTLAENEKTAPTGTKLRTSQCFLSNSNALRSDVTCEHPRIHPVMTRFAENTQVT